MVNKQFFKDLTYEQCQEQVKIRYDQIAQMVGWLYPSILRDEIDELVQCMNRIVEEQKKPKPTMEVWPWP